MIAEQSTVKRTSVFPKATCGLSPYPATVCQAAFFYHPRQYLENGILPVLLDTRTDNLNDSAYIELSTLEMLEKNSKQWSYTAYLFSDAILQEPVHADCIWISIMKRTDEDVRMSIKGYLFKK